MTNYIRETLLDLEQKRFSEEERATELLNSRRINRRLFSYVMASISISYGNEVVKSLPDEYSEKTNISSRCASNSLVHLNLLKSLYKIPSENPDELPRIEEDHEHLLNHLICRFNENLGNYSLNKLKEIK